MATDLSKKGRYWHYAVMVDGKRVRGSTKCENLFDAKIVLESIRKRLILDGVKVAKAPSLSSVLASWLSAAVGVHSPKHIRSTEQMGRLYLVPVLGHLPIDQITSTQVEELMKAYVEGGRSAHGANLLLRTIALLANWAVSHNLAQKVSFAVKPFKAQKKPRKILGKAKDFFAKMDRLSNPQLGVMARVALGLGLRESEILGMRWEWLHAGVYTVGRSKNKKTRDIPVPSWVIEKLEILPKTSEWVFPAADGSPHREGYFSDAVHLVAGIGAHRVRASFATFHIRAGTPINEVQGLLGHADIKTTSIYLEDDLERRKKAQSKFSKSLGLG